MKKKTYGAKPKATKKVKAPAPAKKAPPPKKVAPKPKKAPVAKKAAPPKAKKSSAVGPRGWDASAGVRRSGRGFESQLSGMSAADRKAVLAAMGSGYDL